MKDESRSVKVSIFGRDYDVKGSLDEEYIQTLAVHVSSVMQEISDKTGSISSARVAILAALNIADEMYKERQRFKEFVEKLEQELEKVLEIVSEKDTG